MAKVVSLGHTDTPISGVTTLTFPRAILNYEKDFRIKSNDAGKEVVLTNLTSPLDRPEKIRIAYTEIANIYSGSGVDPAVMAPSKKGVSLLVQLTNVMSVTDDTDPSYRIDQPFSLHLVLKFPSSEYLTGAVVQEQVGRLLSSCFDSGSLSTDRLEALLRGSLIPSDL